MELVVVGNVTFADRPAGRDRSAFVGTLDQVMDDVQTAAEAGADELIVDLNLQDWFTSTQQMLETAVEIRERASHDLTDLWMGVDVAPAPFSETDPDQGVHWWSCRESGTKSGVNCENVTIDDAKQRESAGMHLGIRERC